MSYSFFRKEKGRRKSLTFVGAPFLAVLILIGMVMAFLAELWLSF